MSGQIGRKLRILMRESMDRVYEQREEIIVAFLAKYGCGPEELEQVEERTAHGVVWYVRRKGEP